MVHVTHLECPRCEESYPADELLNLCDCGSPLLVRYDFSSLPERYTPESFQGGRDDMWRFQPFLPVPGHAIISLGEGMTPVFEAPQLGARLGTEKLLIKDEGLNPTGTFKARGAACGVSMANFLGAGAVAMPTAGNAGGAWSAYAARAGMECVIAMPEDAPEVTMKEAALFGAHTYLVRGLISDAGKIIARACEKYDIFDVSTLKEPYRIEGKKTMGLELAMQLGWRVPDAILYPAGGGVGLIGIWKAFEELESIGWLGAKRPKMIAVQSEGCAPLVEAFEEGRSTSDFWEGASTIAGGIRVPKALGDFLVLDAIYKSDGCAVSVSDEEIIETLRLTACLEGSFVCPEGAAALAAVGKLADEGFLSADDEVAVINTGAGLKYSSLVDIDLPVMDPDGEISLPGWQVDHD